MKNAQKLLGAGALAATLLFCPLYAFAAEGSAPQSGSAPSQASDTVKPAEKGSGKAPDSATSTKKIPDASRDPKSSDATLDAQGDEAQNKSDAQKSNDAKSDKTSEKTSDAKTSDAKQGESGAQKNSDSENATDQKNSGGQEQNANKSDSFGLANWPGVTKVGDLWCFPEDAPFIIGDPTSPKQMASFIAIAQSKKRTAVEGLITMAILFAVGGIYYFVSRRGAKLNP